MGKRTGHGFASISRRSVLGLLSAPLATAALGRVAQGASAPTADSRVLGARVFNIRDFGATGDGKTVDTAAVQAAIDACAKEDGGTVLVPAGTFVIGTIELKSNVTLHVAAGGKLFGSGEGKDYHSADAIPLHGDTTLEDGNWALIYAVGASNVTIEGPGMIDGNGARFHAPRGEMPPAHLTGDRRPYLLLFYKCTNLNVRDIDLFQSGYHCLRVIESSYVEFDGIHIHNRVSGNNDGFHFVSAEHVNISNCNVECQDDACALFGACRFVMITNSSFSTRWSVFRFGTGRNGGTAENITVSNCILYEVHGCPIKFQGTAGSVFQNMSFSNLVLQECTGPISISAGRYEGNRDRQGGGGSATRPAATREGGRPACIVRNISFSNIHGTVTTDPGQYADLAFPQGYSSGEKFSAIVLNCVHDTIMENISFDNIHLTFGGGGTAEQAKRELPELAGEYFLLGPIPAYGLYARNVKGLTLNNIRFETATPDLRPAVLLTNVEDASIMGMSLEGNAEAESVVRFVDTKHVLVTSPRVLTAGSVFLRVEGKGSEGIVVDGGDVSKAKQSVAVAEGASETAVKFRS